MRYFELWLDCGKRAEEMWHLGSPVFLESREYVHAWPLVNGDEPAPEDYEGVDFPIQYDGPRTTFTFGGSSDVPLIHRSVAPAIRALGEHSTRLLPCLVGGRDLDYCILVVRLKIACLDFERSVIDYHDETSSKLTRPSEPKIEAIKHIRTLRIDLQKIAPTHHIFRLSESPLRLIVSQSMRDELYKRGASGIAFEEV